MSGAALRLGNGLARLSPAQIPRVRRLELLMRGQAQSESWLTTMGWTKLAGAGGVEQAGLGSAADPSMSEIRDAARPTIVYGVTIANSLDVLLRGQLEGMTDRGWRVHAVSASGPAAQKVFDREQVDGIHTIEMTRRISPAHDLVALWRWILLLRRLRPDVVNASTPKAGLLGMIASWLLRVPIRVYIVRGARYETATGLSRRVMILLEKVAVHCSTHAMVISPSLRDELRASGIGRGGVHCS